MKQTIEPTSTLDLAEDALIDERTKGIPGGTPPFRLRQVSTVSTCETDLGV